MKRLLCIFTMISFFSISVAFYSPSAEAQDADLTGLIKDLQKSGIADSDLKDLSKTMKHMLDKGANKGDIQGIVTDLSKNGLSGKNLTGSFDSVNGLFDAGDNLKDARKNIRKTIRDAAPKGLRGNELAGEIRKSAEHRRKNLRDAMEERRKNRQKKVEHMKDQVHDNRDNILNK